MGLTSRCAHGAASGGSPGRRAPRHPWSSVVSEVLKAHLMNSAAAVSTTGPSAPQVAQQLGCRPSPINTDDLAVNVHDLPNRNGLAKVRLQARRHGRHPKQPVEGAQCLIKRRGKHPP